MQQTSIAAGQASRGENTKPIRCVGRYEPSIEPLVVAACHNCLCEDCVEGNSRANQLALDLVTGKVDVSETVVHMCCAGTM